MHFVSFTSFQIVYIHRMGSELKARELAEYDDIANSICVDPVIGFISHKMTPRYRHVKGM